MNYPPGTSLHDPRAPWNAPEPVDCPDCVEGVMHYVEDGFPVTERCSTCHGTAVIEPDPDEGPDPDEARDRAEDR
jgi:hypothetical protein